MRGKSEIAASLGPIVSAGGSAGPALRVLLVEDSPDDAELLLYALREGGLTPICARVDTRESMAAALAREAWDVIIADYRLPAFSAPEALSVMQAAAVDLPFIIVSGTVGEELAVAAMKSGAHDYIMKDSLARLVPALERELREAAERRERRRAEAARAEEAEVSAALARVAHELIGALDRPVLLERLCQITTSVLSCDTSYTMLAQPIDDAYVLIAGYGATAEEQEIARVIKVPRTLMARVLERLEQDEVLETNEFPAEEWAVPKPTRSLQLCTALRRGVSIIGIQVASRRGRDEPFSNAQRRIARGTAQLASLALEHARVVEELERANRIKSEFVATISHELRTPLNVVMGYTDLLIDGTFGSLNPEQGDTLRRVSARARGLLELINATLDLSRLEAGRIALDAESVEIAQLLGTLETEVHEWQTKPELNVVWDIPKGLPSLWTDGAKLKVVLKNLIGNAVKFTDHGSVTVTARALDHGVEFSVADTGIGIAPEAMPIVFEAFRQGDSSSTRRYGGVGLGLYIVRRLLELLGGTITLESEVGRGSRFRIWIPQRAPDARGGAE